MAGQPTVKVGLLFFMTGDAEAHLKIHPFYPIHPFHGAVTHLTGRSLLYMPLVTEQDVFWEVVCFPPGRGGPGVEILVLFPDLRMIGDDIFMTKKTLLHWRNPRVIGPPSIGMTERALYLLY